MAEEVKKKRGRPPKSAKENENTKTVNESPMDQITMAEIQNKWGEIVRKFGNNQQGLNPQKVNSAYSQAILNNPFIQNQRVKTINSTAYKKEKKEIQQALENPGNNEQALRETSMGLYYTNFVYNNLVRLEREIPNYFSYLMPQYVTKEEMKKDSFQKDIQFANKVLEKFNPQLTFKTINMQVQLEGKCSYLLRKSYTYPKKVDFFLLEKLIPSHVKITSIGSKQQYIVSFNMMLFLNPMYDVSQYPPYIGEIWEQMQANGMIIKNQNTYQFNPQGKIMSNYLFEQINGNYYYWVELNQDDCFTFGQELSTPMAFPSSIGLFLDLKELDDYRWLMGNLMSKGVTSILTAEVPIHKDAKAGSDATIITPDLISFYDEIFSRTVSSNVMTYFAPFKNFELHNIDSQPDNMNIIYNRLRDLVATSGNAALLSISDKPSVAMVKATEAIAASRAKYLTLQFEQFLNHVINEQFNLKHEYKVTLWGDIFDTADDFKKAKELLQNGVQSMLPRVLSFFGQSVEDMRTFNDYIDVIGLEIYSRNNNEEGNNSNNSSTSQDNSIIGQKEVGRTTIEETEIENDSTAASRDNGDNVSDTKEFSRFLKKNI